MDSQCGEEPRMLERVRKKRRLSSGNNLADTTGASSRLSTFVQSALRHTPLEGPEMGQHENSSKRRSGSSNRKKRRLVSHELKRRLETVRFPGYSEEEKEEEECEDSIDIFSESGSEMEEIEEGEGGREEETQLKRPPTAIGVSKRNRKETESRGRHRKTPRLPRTVPSSGAAENILEFDSCSSESSPESLREPAPLPFPLSQLHTSTPLTTITSPPHTSTPVGVSHNLPHWKQSMTLGEFRSLVSNDDHRRTATPTPEYQSIVTPPSSPEATPPAKRSGVKQSEWVRQITLESDELGVTTAGADDTMFGLSETVLRGQGEGVESGGRGMVRGRKGRVVAGGLAAAAEMVAQRERSEIAFWEHRARHLDDSTTDLSACMTVEVCSLTNSHSLTVTSCRTLSSGWLHSDLGRESDDRVSTALREEKKETPMEGGEGGEIVTVLFSGRCAKFVSLQVGQIITIHPPWQCLTTPSSGQKVVLCTHFCLPLPLSAPRHSSATAPLHLPTPPSLTSSHGHRVGGRGLCQMRSPHRSPATHPPSLTKSPAQFGVVPKRLFPAPDAPSAPSSHPLPLTTHSTGKLGESDARPPDGVPGPPTADGGTPATSTGSVVSGRVSCVLLEAMEGATRGLLSLHCRILRVYRRTLPSTTRLSFGREARQWPSRRACQLSRKSRWCLVVCDASGSVCELQVTDSTHPSWSEVVRGGEGGVYVFRDVRVSRRTNPARNPELFSLIGCLCGQLAPAATHSCGQSPGGGGEIYSRLIPIPSYCYILASGPESVVMPCQGEEEEESLFPALAPSTVSAVTGGGCDEEVTRVSLYARVVHCQPEIPVDELCNVYITPHHGYYLFIVTPSPSSLPSLDTPPSPTAHARQLLRVYVKASFSQVGMANLLGSPGQRLLIRDVEVKRDKGRIQYSMDACSLVLPLGHPQQEEVYPQYKFSGEEERLLHSLSPPTLPLLSPLHDDNHLAKLDGEIVAVDEDSAFSWPECDRCGNDQLSSTTSDTGEDEGLYCDACSTKVVSPSIHLQLAVFIKPSHNLSRLVCVQLLQSTITELLPVSAATLDEGFDVNQVLGRTVCLDACCIHGTRRTKFGQAIPYLREISISPETPSYNHPRKKT